MRVGASPSQFILSAFATLAILALLVFYAFKGELSISDIAFLVFLGNPSFSYINKFDMPSLCSILVLYFIPSQEKWVLSTYFCSD